MKLLVQCRHSTIRKIIFYLSFLLLALAATAYAEPLQNARAQTDESAEPVIEAVQERVEASGQYAFTAQIEQTLIPRAVAANLGQQEERLDSQITAEVTLPDQLLIDLRFEADSSMPAVTLEQDGPDTYLHQDGKRTLIENPMVGALPAGDFLGYLHGVYNLEITPNPDLPEYTVYTFDIDGGRYADYIEDILRRQAQGNQHGRMMAPDFLQAMTGSGELWVDGDGYPQRQVLDLFSPDINEQHDSRSHIVVDYRFDAPLTGVSLLHSETILAAAAENREAAPTDNLASGTAVSPPSESTLALNGLPITANILSIPIILLLILFMALLVKRPRWFRIALPVTLTLLIGFSPLMQSVARAQEADNGPTPLLEALGVEDDEGMDRPALLPPNPNAPQLLESAENCGLGDTTIDSDQDGTPDFVELCVGTSPHFADSDGDFITDTLEIEGFMYNDQRFYSNPLDPDTNQDGVDDQAEWYSGGEFGMAPAMDVDGDGIPNLWDEDNDGDGVPDSIDDDIYTVSDFRDSFSLRTTLGQSSFGGYQYIEFQIQPENPDHLRYTTSKLDWPYDDQGNIQDLDNSTDDITLEPYLRIRTADLPGSALRETYNISYNLIGTENYDLYVPLTAISHAGNIVAFQGKAAYASDQLQNIEWANMELLWMVMMAQDEQVGDEIHTEVIPIAQYIDPYRFTSLMVTKNAFVDYALLGMPDSPADDRQMAQLMMGLENTFLAAMNPGLDELTARFTSPTTPLTQTWGLEPGQVAIARPLEPPGHFDGLPLSVAHETLAFLETNPFPYGEMVGVVTAMQGDIGSHSLINLVSPESKSYVFNLANIPMQTVRSIVLSHYQHDGVHWQALEDSAVADVLAEKYADISAVVAELQVKYPDLTAEELQLIMGAFIFFWRNGQFNVVQLDGTILVPLESLDSEISEVIDLPDAAHILSYLIEANGLAEPGGGLIPTDVQGYYEYVLKRQDTTFNKASLFSSGVLKVVWTVWSWIGGPNAYYIKLINKHRHGTILAFTARGEIWKLSIQRSKTMWASKPAGGLKLAKWKLYQRLYDPSWVKLTKAIKVLQWVSVFFDLVTFGVVVAMIWLMYASFHSLYGYEYEIALGHAVVETILETIYLIIGFFTLGIIITAILGLAFIIVDSIAAIVGADFRLQQALVAQITRLYIDVHPYTRLLNIDYDGIELDFNGELVTGVKMTLSDKFTGYLNEVRDDASESERSDAYGFFDATAENDSVTVGTSRSKPICESDQEYFDGVDYRYYDDTRICENFMYANFTFNEAGINQQVSVKHRARIETRYKQCGAETFLSTGKGCVDKSDVMYLPDELGDGGWGWIDLPPMDILPAAIEGLWNWPALTNNQPGTSAYALNDSDGDGLSYKTEMELGTDPENWDTDGDGLSDYYEIQPGVDGDPNSADSDLDGLPDGLENRIGTLLNVADTDGDGLSDGVEVFHWDGSQWTGGGWYTTILGQDYWVFSEAGSVDGDQDNYNDFSEYQIIAPAADNAGAPLFTLDAGPLQISPNNESGVYARSGQVITAGLSIINVGGARITDTLSLCLPAALTNINVTASGDRVPATQVNGNCYEWDFSSQNLTFLQEFQVAVTAEATGSTESDAFTASLPYPVNGVPATMQRQIPYIQDNTAPTVQITEPISRSILIGDYFVMGGLSQDMGSWVDHVKITVPAGTYTAAGTAPWAYTWELPDEGIIDVTAVAYDTLGNASAPASVQVIVDSLAPVITSNLSPNTTISAGESYSDTILLSGTVTDNYAGLVRVQMRYNEQPWRTIWQTDTTPLNTTWSGLWELPAISESAQGEHTLHLRAYDDFGNIGYTDLIIFVDLLPPTSDLTNRSYLQTEPVHVLINEPLTLYGVANDAGNNPLPAGPADLSGNLHSIGDATFWLQPDTYEDNDAGVTVSWIGDFNGDRLGDLAVGFPAYAGGTGKVVIVTGEAGGWPIPNVGQLELLAEHSPSFIGRPGTGLGSVIQPAGDIDGDGFEEFIIGDPANGRAFLVYGSPSGFGIEQRLEESRAAKWSEISSSAAGETVTTAFAAAGDVNNDGLADFLVSATTGSSGYVYLLLGDPSPSLDYTVNEMAGAVLETAGAGAAAAGVGDVNGDFIDDFAVAFGGTVYLFAGGGGWSAADLTSLNTADALTSFSTNDALPTITGLGDVDLDGTADFAYSDGSSPVVVFGSAAESFTTQTLGGFASPLSGFLAAAGDVDKDDRGDLLIGNGDGDAYLILGSDLNSVAATIEGVESAAAAPYIAGADLAGDGSSDLLVVPSNSAASGMGYETLVENRPPFISPDSLPQAAAGGGSSPANSAVNSPALKGEPPAFISGDVTVAPAGADFTSIQAALDSGADRVLIEPGIYQEAITLTGNVVLAGSGAGLTYLSLPVNSSADTLITVDGVSNASLLNMTLLGKGTGTGLAVLNGADNMMMTRTIVRDFETAVLIDGSTADLTLKNLTILGNADGLKAVNCAPVDVRNTIFAYNTGTALQYEGCAAVQNHQYNLYWANGADMLPNDPGGGELFSDPLFVDFGRNDFRTELHSPVIDAGSPTDAVPPGAGSFADIGHMEQTGSSFFADQSYCPTCANDGLIWGVDAFDTIQAAVDAAQADIAALAEGTGTPFAVGVGSGTYTETVLIEYNLRLLGSGPDNTTIQGSGGPAVILSTTVGSEVSGFTLIGGGPNPVGVHIVDGSSGVALSYNLIKENETAVLVNGRSSGLAQFNTIISNTTAVSVTNPYNWLDAANNIISHNTNGLAAANGAAIFSDYNLLFNTANYTNVIPGPNDLLDVDPLLTGSYGYLQAGSPAIDAAAVTGPIPPGGGVRADIGWHELLAAPISLFMGQSDDSIATESIGVGQVEYAIVPVTTLTTPVTSTLPTAWTLAGLNDPGAKLSYWTAVFTPTTTGYYRIYSRAADTLGNAETNAADWYEGAFVVDDTAPVVNLGITYPPGVQGSWVQMNADVFDYIGRSFDVTDVYFEINGRRVDGAWDIDQWEEDGTTPRKFHYMFMNDSGITGYFTFQAFAVDGAGQLGASPVITSYVAYYPVNYFYDATPPGLNGFEIFDQITDTVPIDRYDDIVVSGDYFFKGTGTDKRDNPTGPPWEFFSRVQGFEISFDGGLTWETTRLVDYDPAFGNDHFIYTWTVPINLDATTIPMKVRVTDYAGLSRVSVVTVTVDSAAPRLMGDLLIDTDAAVGSHLDDSLPVTFSWIEPTDGSGHIQMYRNFGAIEEDDAPTFLTNEISATVSIAGPGVFRANVGAADPSGNIDWVSYGDWWVGSVGNPFINWNAGNGSQSLALTTDGILEVEYNEWLTATEWLDSDGRPAVPQSLYATWDGRHSYIGWAGAAWDTDGQMWVYWDLWDAAGTTTPVSGDVSLPFAADYAVNVSDAGTAEGWEYDGAAWVASELEPFMGHDPESGGTEFIFQFSETLVSMDFDHHRLFAYAVDNNDQVWSSFPTLNTLDGEFTYFYEWPVTVGPDLLKLPIAAQPPYLAMDVAGTPPVQDTLSHGSSLQFVIDIDNFGDKTSENVQVQLTGSTGVNYLSVSGAACNDCASPNSWLLDVSNLDGGQNTVITVTAELDGDMTGIAAVTNTIQLQTDLLLPLISANVHVMDLEKPTISTDANPGHALGTGQQEIHGQSSDGFGAGVALVEVSLDGSSWQTAVGTLSWSTFITVPVSSGSFPLYARATDYHGQVSDVEITSFTIDEAAPLITPTVPAVIGNAVVASLGGTASDPAPVGAQVQTVEAQFDSLTGSWNNGTIGAAAGNAEQLWSYPWLLPNEEGVTHTVRFRATDYGGNVTYSDWFTTVVDTAAPAITVTDYITQAVYTDTTPILSGVAADGYALDEVRALFYPLFGSETELPLTLINGQWSVNMAGMAAGPYTIIIAAEDSVGNTSYSAAYQVELTTSGVIPVTTDQPAINSGDGLCSITEAIENANDAFNGLKYTDCAAGHAAEMDTVVLQSGAVYTLTADHTDSTGLPLIDSEIVILGSGATIVRDSAAPAFRFLQIASGGRLTMTNTTLRNGSADVGGAIYSQGTLNLVNANILDSTATTASDDGGGAIMLDGGDNSTISGGTFSGNSGFQGGAILLRNTYRITITNASLISNTSTTGGGIYVDLGTVLWLSQSTFAGNTALGNSGGALFNNSWVRVENSTFYSNTAAIGGGAIRNNGYFSATYSTFSHNSAGTAGANLYNNDKPAAIDLYANIFANSVSGGDCYNDGGYVLPTLYNLIEDTGPAACGLVDGVDGNIIGVDPLLESLADNGGASTGSGQATKTMALQPGSPALDAIPTGDCVVTVDQRGVARPSGAGCDIGAYEEGLLAAAGDVGCDGELNVLDALYIMQFEVGMLEAGTNCPPEPDTIYLPACDVNGDTFCNVVDALFIMQCEVGIANSFCPGLNPSESQIESLNEEFGGTGTGLRPSSRPSIISVGSGAISVGDSIVVPLRVIVPVRNSLTAVTVDLTFDPAVVAFTNCQPNDTGFTLSLCNLSHGDRQSSHTITFTALAVSGVNGELLLGEAAFTGLAGGVTDLTLTVRAFEDGSDLAPRSNNGVLRVGQ